MKSLKIALLQAIIIAAVSSIGLQAQSVGFHVKAGLNLSNLSFDGPNLENSSGEMLSGFHIGAMVELPVSSKFSIETGLLLQSKGYQSEFTSTVLDEDMDSVQISGDQKTSLLYLDVPILLKGRFDLGGINLIASAGPYFGFGLSGTTFFEYPHQGENYEEEAVIDYGDQGDFKSVDYGLMATAGVEFSNVILSATYAYGLANIETFEPDTYTTRHQNIMISLGVRLAGEEKEKRGSRRRR
jgi:hypothetical protein